MVVVRESERARENVAERTGSYTEFKRNLRYFYSESKELREKHPNEYIAIYRKEVIDHDKNPDALLARLKGRYGDLRAFVIEYISSTEKDLIL